MKKLNLITMFLIALVVFNCGIIDPTDDETNSTEETTNDNDSSNNDSDSNNNNEPQTVYYRCNLGFSCDEYEDLADYQIDEPFQDCSGYNDMPQFSGIIWEESKQCPTSNLIGICTRIKFGVMAKRYYYTSGDWSFIDDFTTWCTDTLNGTWTGG